MLDLLEPSPKSPERVVVIGAGGFVGGAICRALEGAGVTVARLGRANLDLLAADAKAKLAVILRPTDAVVMVSAAAPVRDTGMLIDNLRMVQPVEAALRAVKPAHLVYVSSDAVYADSVAPLIEASCAAPGSPHGAMHLAREIALAAAAGDAPFAILRPTLIYGPRDPHNGYGPNRFRREALAGGPIHLFGNGEERRDHVHVDDVGEIARRVVMHRAKGAINVATGVVTSFHEIAELVAAKAPTPVSIAPSPRTGPMPHNGYRPFDIAACRAAFPDFCYRSLDDGLAALMNDPDA